MGITNFSISLLEKVVKDFRPRSVIELGSQNLYTTSDPNPPFADVWYKENGFTGYTCIDLAGDNRAVVIDLSHPFPTPEYSIKNADERPIIRTYDLVTDWGSSEHVVQMEGYHSVAFHDGHINSIYPTEVKNIEEGYYNCWLNKFNLCKVGGIILSENPKHNHWPGHGFHYIEQEFYEKLERMIDVEIVELGEHPASGNAETGMNVYAILRKTGNNFTALENFWSLPIYKS